MIVTQLLGGLGNQLFQYSAGRALAARHGTTLRFDSTRLGQHRAFALKHFGIRAQELTETEYSALRLPAEPKSRLQRYMARFFNRPSIPVLRERRFEFDPEVLEAPARCYLQGYWQSPKYFSAIGPHIREEIKVRESLAGKNLEMASLIGSCEAVSVHVRRGDYANNPETYQVHGTCGPAYYRGAEATILQRCGRPTLFVFSDDPDWAAHNLKFESKAIFLRHNGPDQGYEDLRLMTLCKHHIIANSTFSWWGAWLCLNPGKTVVAPRDWFREARRSTVDLIPEGWIQL